MGGAQIRLAIAAVVITIAAGVAYYIHYQSGKIETLQTEKAELQTNNKTLIDNNAILKSNLAQLNTVNDTNAQTIQSLLTERVSAQKAITALANASAANKQVISGLNKRLADIIKDPKNDGVLAPVLRETIRDIQDTRR
jgi:hypothetical protein